MSRAILSEANIHPAIQQAISSNHKAIVDEVQNAVASHGVVVVGMSGNPFCKKARKALDAAGVTHHYLEYGNYFGMWRQRNALKMWTGWPSFPMVFVRGTLVGGAADLEKLISSGELKKMPAE